MTGGEADVTLLSVAVLFDDSTFSYEGAPFATYALYTPPAKGAIYMVPANTNGQIRVGTINQINLDWMSSGLPDGNRDPGSFRMASLEFGVISHVYGSSISLSNNSPGNILQLEDGSQPFNAVCCDIVFIPEPATALLVGLGLLGLGISRRG